MKNIKKDKSYRKEEKHIGVSILIFLSFFLSSCGTKDYTIHFNENMKLDYNGRDSPLTLINKIGDTEVNKEMIQDNQIKVDNFVISCESVDTGKIGYYEIRYTTNDTENRYIVKVVQVADISPPEIKLKKDKLEMTLEEYKKFDFKSVITVQDNWDQDDPIIKLETKEIKDPGEYTIKIIVTDIAGNEAKEEIKLTIKEETKEETNKEDTSITQSPVQTPNSAQGSQNSNGINNNSPQQQIPSEPSYSPPKNKPANKEFLFINGYERDTIGTICHNELRASGLSGQCIPILDENGLELGMRLEYD